MRGGWNLAGQYCASNENAQQINQPDRGIPVYGFSARVQAPAGYLTVMREKT
jgi:hypothetical protein